MLERITLDGEIGPGRGGRRYRAVLIRAGEWQGKGLRAAPAVLQAAAPLFEGAASFLNPRAPEPGAHGHPPLERLVGAAENAAWDPDAGGIAADYVLAETPAALWVGRMVDGWLATRRAGRPAPPIGLSAVLSVRPGPPGAGGVREVEAIVSVDSVDIVYRPAAGGEFLRILNAEGDGPDGPGEEMRSMEEILGGETAARRRAAPEGTAPAAEAAPAAGVAPGAGVAPAAAAAPAAVTAPAAAAAPAAAELATLLAAQREALLEAKLAASGLPETFRRLVREGLPPGWRVAELDGAIERVRAAWADAARPATVQGVHGRVTGMADGLDRAAEALAALIEGRRPRDGVPPLSGIREAYVLLSGDYEMTGLFHAERVALANVSSTTMANVVANVMNKVVAQEFQSYPRWWEPVVRRESFNTLQTVKWIMLGGVGELPAVSEGAAYTELTWDDASETAAWQKRGGYLGLTVEAMDKDDVGRLRAAPRALAQAAWLTLGRSISAIFTAASGAGPTMSDGVALFHANHGNLGTTALSLAAWQAARLAMRKRTEVNSGERLGALTSPKYLLVPPDLEPAALTVLASEGLPGSANNDINPEAEGNTFDARMASARRRIIVVDLWTDANDWAAVADPRLYPTIGLGFRYGETPEIFSVASPTSGLMFTNDVMPVKVRWFYAAGPMDYRGLYKANVA